MESVSRRSFVATASLIPFALWAKQNGLGAAMAPRIRYDARSPNGIAMLSIYAAAVQAMQSKNTGNPQSWNFQWYIHCIPGSSAPSQQAPQKTAAINAAYPPGTPAQKAIALAAWDTCQAHYSGLEDYFLPWHRMYVYYLESIVRKVSGKDNFTLPYWDYSVAGPNHGVIPPEFRKPNDPLFKYLYVKKRRTTPDVNNGDPIDQNDPGSLSLSALAKCNYSTVGAVTGFCEDLDGGLHGNVHVEVGGSQNMGSVPWAAGDPIFWVHHCNIDRLWASWNKGGRPNPSTASFLSKQFTFADANGNAVVAKIGDVLDTVPLNYVYDRYEPVPPCRRRPNLKFSTLATTQLELGPAPVTKTLKTQVLLQGPKSMKARLPQLADDQRIYLVLKHLRSQEIPGVVYHVFLALPDGADPRKSEQYKVGVINFFNVAGHDDHSGASAHDPTYSFDVTDLLKRLGGALPDEPKVTIAPFDRPAEDARPVVGEASLVQQ